MASTGSENAVSLIDWAKTRDPKGNSADIAELMTQSNELINHMYWQEGNGANMHRISQRIGLPTVYYRQLGQAVNPSKSGYAQFDEGMSICDGWSEIDVELAKMEGDEARFRFLEALGFIEAQCQQFATTFFYGDTTANPERFMGMNARYSTMVAASAGNAQNVLNGGGTGSVNTSVWLLNSGPRSLMGIFPKGTPSGIQRKDFGQQVIPGAAGYAQGRLEVFQEKFSWKAGIALKDWRWCVRICNVDTDNLVNETGAADLLKLMTKAMYRVPSISTPASTTGNPLTSIAMTGRPFFAMNRTAREMLEIQAQNKTNSQLKLEDVDGRKVLSFKGIPLTNSDALLNTEATVV
jgi:hypothetical protein